MAGKDAPIHCGVDRLVTVDIRASGPSTLNHDLLEVAFVVADRYMVPDKRIDPFQIKMRPRNLGSYHYAWLKKYNLNEKLTEFQQAETDYFQAAELFKYWIEHRVRLPRETAKLQLITYDFTWTHAWLSDWLGDLHELYIRPRNRDIRSAANFLMDCADYRHEAMDWNSCELETLRRTLGCENERPGDTLHSCLTYMEMYRRIIGKVV